MLLNIDKIINSAGLIFDLTGAWLIAWEVVNQFHGSKLSPRSGPRFPGVSPVSDNPEYLAYEKKKYYKMKIGLGFITLGFLLQILSSWIVYILQVRK